MVFRSPPGDGWTGESQRHLLEEREVLGKALAPGTRTQQCWEKKQPSPGSCKRVAHDQRFAETSMVAVQPGMEKGPRDKHGELKLMACCVPQTQLLPGVPGIDRGERGL